MHRVLTRWLTTVTLNTDQELQKQTDGWIYTSFWRLINAQEFSFKSIMIHDQRPHLRQTAKTQTKSSNIPKFAPVLAHFFPATLHFIPHTLLCGFANITFHLVHIPLSTSWRNGGGMVDINLGQLYAQFLPLSELFASAPESFIIMGSWCAKVKAWLLAWNSPFEWDKMALGKNTVNPIPPVFEMCFISFSVLNGFAFTGQREGWAMRQNNWIWKVVCHFFFTKKRPTSLFCLGYKSWSRLKDTQ